MHLNSAVDCPAHEKTLEMPTATANDPLPLRPFVYLLIGQFIVEVDAINAETISMMLRKRVIGSY